MSLVLNGTNGLSDVDGSAATPAIRGTDANTGIFFPAADTIAFAEGGAEVMRIDSSGNVGIGTTSPTNIAGYKSVTISSTTGGWLEVTNGTVRGALQNGSGDVTLETRSAHPLIFGVNGTERARIAASGLFAINNTGISDSQLSSSASASGTFAGTFVHTGSGGYGISIGVNGGFLAYFYASGTRSGGPVGSIQTNGSTTTFATTSDYRLKEDVQQMTGALAKVAALKPVTYTWKNTGQRDEGFIAHELQEVCPSAVTGKKDAVNEDGSINPQGIDTSFLVATLTAALQEAHGLITALTARVEALEGTQP